MSNEAANHALLALKQKIEEAECKAAECKAASARSAGPCPGWAGPARPRRSATRGTEHDFRGGECWHCEAIQPGWGQLPDVVSLTIDEAKELLEVLGGR
ncbi:MAG TPA: hypothetical protein VEI97_14450 [bacterium]|nr:hypothetical protein [bacterium]